MRRYAVVSVLALMLACMAAEPSWARWGNSGGGGSGGSHSHSRSRSSSGFIVRNCKTKACFKKHPGGHYSVPVGRKRKHKE